MSKRWIKKKKCTHIYLNHLELINSEIIYFPRQLIHAYLQVAGNSTRSAYPMAYHGAVSPAGIHLTPRAPL